MDFERLKAEVKEDLTLTPDNAELKSLKSSSMSVKYLDHFFAETRILKDILAIKDKKYATLLHDLRKNGYDNFEVRGKEADHYICLNEDYQKIVSEYKNQEFIVSYLEKTLDLINKISFNVKNFIDINKIKMGVS